MFRLLIILNQLFKSNIEVHLNAPALWLIKCFFPWTWFYQKKAPQAYQSNIEALGPLFIKLGQWLSTRSDLLTREWIDALSQLQDNTTPTPWDKIQPIFQSQWGKDWASQFKTFEKTPIASASLAQAYRAIHLENEQPVIIKVLKPGVKKQVAKDCRLLLKLTALGCLFSPHLRQLGIKPLVQQMYDHLMIETDFSHELGNLSMMHHHAEKTGTFKTAQIIWPLSNQSIIVQTELSGLSFSALMSHPDKRLRAQLAHQLFELFFKQVFDFNLFHADWHPGNWRVDTTTQQFLLMDFGLVGTLSEQDKWAIALNLKAFFERDYDAVVRYHIAAGWFSPDIDKQACASTIRALGERFLHQSQDDKAVSELLRALIQMGHQYQLNLQPQLLLLQKSLATLEGLTKQLDPQFNLINTLGPFLNQWVKKQYQAAACPKSWPKMLFQLLPRNDTLQSILKEA